MKHYCAALAILFHCFVFSAQNSAQNLTADVQPAPLLRLTGILEVIKEPQPSAFPVIRVWIGDLIGIFRVGKVEAVIPAYRAEERLREVSPLGLRFLAEGEVFAALETPEMHDRPIVIRGWLRPQAGILRVRSAQLVENPA